VREYLRRLVTTGAAYQFSDIVAKGLALVTLPLYTRHLTASDYGVAEVLITVVILVSIVLRFGVGEAFVRFYFLDEDADRRDRVLAPVRADPAFTAALAGSITGGVVGSLVEDSGPVLLVVATFALGSALSYLWGRPAPRVDADAAPQAPGRLAVAQAPAPAAATSVRRSGTPRRRTPAARVHAASGPRARLVLRRRSKA